MQDGVLDAADVLVHRQPVFNAPIDHGPRAVGTGEADVVPRRIHEGVHGVGFAARRLAAFRARAVDEVGALGERVARAVRHAVLGQHYRQVRIRNRHVAAAAAMNDRDRASPVALARDAPVAQPPQHLLFAQPLRLQVGRDRVNGLVIPEAVVFPGADANAVLAFVPSLPMIGRECAGVGSRGR